VLVTNVHAGELCRFAGTTDYAGRVVVTANADTHMTDGTTTLDVTLIFEGTPFPFVRIRYLAEEISTWESGQLRSLAANTRYLVDGHIVRQIWDGFDRSGGGLNAYRIQGKQLKDLERKHPGFARHWDPATFGQAWTHDYWAANPERRPDLDLPASSAGPDLRSPLALAFYWCRWMPQTGHAVTVFLPGFKKDKSVNLTIAADRPPRDGWKHLQTSVLHPALSTRIPSTVHTWISMDGHLLQLAFAVQRGNSTAYGVLRQEGCIATPGSSGPPG